MKFKSSSQRKAVMAKYNIKTNVKFNKDFETSIHASSIKDAKKRGKEISEFVAEKTQLSKPKIKQIIKKCQKQ